MRTLVGVPVLADLALTILVQVRVARLGKAEGSHANPDFLGSLWTLPQHGGEQGRKRSVVEQAVEESEHGSVQGKSSQQRAWAMRVACHKQHVSRIHGTCTEFTSRTFWGVLNRSLGTLEIERGLTTRP